MKIRASVKTICGLCRIIKRHGRLMNICEIKKHKTAQGVQKRKKRKIKKFQPSL